MQDLLICILDMAFPALPSSRTEEMSLFQCIVEAYQIINRVCNNFDHGLLTHTSLLSTDGIRFKHWIVELSKFASSSGLSVVLYSGQTFSLFLFVNCMYARSIRFWNFAKCLYLLPSLKSKWLDVSISSEMKNTKKNWFVTFWF